jgi:hypothetical protein
MLSCRQTTTATKRNKNKERNKRKKQRKKQRQTFRLRIFPGASFISINLYGSFIGGVIAQL